MPASILVVEPNPNARELIGFNLQRAGHRTRFAADADSALMLAGDHPPELMLLEWDLPGASGIALLRRLRAQHSTRELPLIMMSARSKEHDKVLALESGADDYITKPYGARETIARVHALLRRRAPAGLPEAIHMAGLRLDPGTQRVMAGALPVTLGPVEFRLLKFLMRHPERVHSRAQLLDQVWGNHAVLDERTVDAHVGRLRGALQASGHQRHIETVRGSGYRFAM
jgi:two-component system phosphate regulon response regulator PhoB